jgi:RNA polymerase sigma-70 factor (ECF subfamily)
MVPHLEAAYNLARWLTRSDTDAQDIVQEAYMRGLRYFDAFTGGDAKSWLLAIVRNTFLTWHQRRGQNTMAFDEQLHSAHGKVANPEEAAIRVSRLDSLKACVEALPDEYRETLVMRELEEMPYQRIADVVGVPVGTVMSRLSRARKRVGECMASKGELP